MSGMSNTIFQFSFFSEMLCSLDWSGIHYIDQAALELSELSHGIKGMHHHAQPLSAPLCLQVSRKWQNHKIHRDDRLR